MVRILFYSTLLGVGVVAGMFNPLVAVICCLEAYLLNPNVFIDFDLRFQLIATVALLVSYLLNRPRALDREGAEGSLVWALWAFVFLGALSALWAVESPEVAITAITEVAKTVLFVSLIISIVRTEQEMSWLIRACLVGVFHAALLHTMGVRFGYVPESVARTEAAVLPDMHGSVMVIFLPTLLLLAMMGTKYERLLCWLSLPLVLSSIVTTNQRTYFLAMVAECALALLFLPKRYALRLLPVLAVGAGLFLFRLTSEDYWERMRTIQAPTEEGSANSRFVINEASRKILADYPMGVGYRNYPDVSPRYLSGEYLTEGRRSAHNTFFTVACETGYLGLAIWAYAFGGSIWQLRRIRKSGNRQSPTRLAILATGLEVGIYGWLCGGLTQSDHEVDPAYWFIAFTVVLTRLHHQEKSRGLTQVPDTRNTSTLQTAHRPYR